MKYDYFNHMSETKGTQPLVLEPKSHASWHVGADHITKSQVIGEQVRSDDQDSWMFNTVGFIILDGVGANPNSRDAVDMTLNEMRSILDPNKIYSTEAEFRADILEASDKAALAILAKYPPDQQQQGLPDTTFTLARWVNIQGERKLFFASVGDSPLSVISGGANEKVMVDPLSRVDTIASYMFGNSQMFEEVVDAIDEAFETMKSERELQTHQRIVDEKMHKAIDKYERTRTKEEFERLEESLREINTTIFQSLRRSEKNIYEQYRKEHPRDEYSVIDLYAFWLLRNLTNTLNPNGQINISFGSYTPTEQTIGFLATTDGITDNLTRHQIEKTINDNHVHLTTQTGVQHTAEVMKQEAITIAQNPNNLRAKPDDMTVLLFVLPAQSA